MEDEQYRIVVYQIGFCKEQRKELLPIIKQYPYVCVYCSDNATCRDHLLPLPYTGTELRRSIPTVPSCHECNITLSDRVIPIFAERALYIAEKLRIRYKKLLASHRWTDEDLKELGYTLRQGIQRSEYKRRRLEFRLEVLDCGGLTAYPGLPLADGPWRVSVEDFPLDSSESGTQGALDGPSAHVSDQGDDPKLPGGM